MDKLQNIRGVALILTVRWWIVPGLAAVVDMALYALELPVAGEERVITDWQRRRRIDGTR